MSSRVAPIVASVLLMAAAACGDDGGGGSNPATDGGDTTPGADADPNAPDATPGSFSTLIDATWTNGAGNGDTYYCAWKAVQEDMYITGFEAVSPQGTHHTVLSVTDSYSGPDKEQACNAGEIADQMLFASGVGTASYALPAGVAIKVTAGQTLMLNLHLFNVSDETLNGTSGTMVTRVPLEEVENLAEFFFAGTAAFSIPGNGQDTMASGSCTMAADGTVFTLWPHMHQVGKHMRISYKGTDVLNTDYDFNDQKMYSIAPFAVQQGDTIDVECTWNNPSGPNKNFGDGSNDEMCFGGIYRYPVSGQDTFCIPFL